MKQYIPLFEDFEYQEHSHKNLSGAPASFGSPVSDATPEDKLITYFKQMWSKDKSVQDQIQSDPELQKKYDKYIKLSDEEWGSFGPDELNNLLRSWNTDSHNINPVN